MRIMLGLLFVMLLACGGAGGDYSDYGKSKKRSAPVVVEIHTIAAGEVVKTLDSHAVLESMSQADLYPNVASQVLSVSVEEGQSVKAGQVLAVLEAVSQGAGAERADADVSKLRRDLTHTESLYQRGAVSTQELEEAKYQLQAALSSAKEARHSYGKTRITSPFDGVVAIRDVRVGEVAQAGTRAFQVVDLHNLQVVSQLPERDLRAVKVGQEATLISAYDESLVSSGVVSMISPVVDPTTGTFRVTVDVDDGQEALRPGQFVTIKLEVERHRNVPVVPKQALIWEAGVSYVYRKSITPEPEPESEPEASEGSKFNFFGGKDEEKVKEEEEESFGPSYRVERAVLELGLSDDENTEILKGLSIGDEVVLIGYAGLKDGSLVRLPAEEAEIPVSTDSDDSGEDAG